MGVLQRFWTKHRLATVLCFALLFLGLLLQPWSLVLVLAVSFGGPLLKRLESFKASPINSWRRDHWIGVALGLSVVLLALTGGNSGRGALILALLPVAWVLVKDRSLLQDKTEIEHGSTDEPLALSATDAEVENNTEPPEPLVGAELLAKVKELGDVGKSDLVRACGYFSIKEDGGERLNFTGFYEALLGAKGVGLDSSSGGNDDEGEDEEKSIYIKTEPGGHVLFGKLSEEQVDELRACIENQELSEELSEIGDNSYGQLAECDGVINSGDEGDFGNEGTITYSTDQPALGPEVDDEGTYADGVYVVVMKLSKCSIEFEFNAEGGFDEDEFEEISVPVRIPEEIEHGLYGHPDFNIITGFKFRGEDVEEYEGEVEDRGYDVQLTFFAVNDGETTILYSNYNGEEDWQDPDYSVEAISQIPEDAHLCRNEESKKINENLPEDWQKLSDDEITYKLENEANIPEEVLIELVLEDGYNSYTFTAGEKAKGIENLSIKYLEKLIDKHFDDSISMVSDNVLRRQLITTTKLDHRDFQGFINKENDYIQSNEEVEPLIKSAIALNKSLPSDLLTILQIDSNEIVNWSATEGRKLSSNLITLEDTELDIYLSQRIEMNHVVTKSDLDILCSRAMLKTSCSYVKNLLKYPGLDAKLLQNIDETQGGDNYNSDEIMMMLIKSPSCLDELLEKYSKSDNSDFRLSVFARELPDEWRFLEDYEMRNKLSEEIELDRSTLVSLRNYISQDEFIKELNSPREDILQAFIAKGGADVNMISKLLEIAKNDDDIYMARRIALIEELDDSTLVYLQSHEDNEVRLIANTLRKLPKEWWCLSEWEIAEKLKTEVDLPESVISTLSDTEEEMIKKAIATRRLPSDWWSLNEDEKAERVDREDLDPDLLDCLVEASDIAESNLRYNIACKENAYDATYIKLRNGSFQNWKQNRCSDSVSDKASEQLLARKLPIELRSLDENTLVEKIKDNKVDSEILQICGEFGSTWVRDAAAKNPNTPTQTIAILFDDVHGYIQKSTVFHPNCPASIISNVLANDGEDYEQYNLKEFARLRDIDPKLIPLILDNEYKQIARLVKQRDVDIDSVMLLSESTIEDLRACAVYSDQLPPDTLEKLSADSNYYVEEAFKLAKLPADWIGINEDDIREKLKEGAVPDVVYEVFTENDTASIRALIAKSNGVPQSIINKLMEDENEEVKFALLERQLPEQWRVSDDEQRIEMLKADNIDEGVLFLLATDTGFNHWQVRVAVANSPSAAPTLLKQLSKDSDSDVQAAARNALKLIGEESSKKRSGPITYYFGVYQGDSNSGSCYLAELQTIEQGDHDVDDGEISDELREELEEGCIGWGPFKDQNLVVWTEEDGEEDIVAVVDIEEAIDNDSVHDCQTHLGYDTKGKHIIGVLTEKGGFNGEAELEAEDFDEDKITFGLVNLADNWFIINSIQYDGEEIEMEGDSTGKSSEYYKFEDDETEYIC